jgi:hypothetical protein
MYWKNIAIAGLLFHEGPLAGGHTIFDLPTEKFCCSYLFHTSFGPVKRSQNACTLFLALIVDKALANYRVELILLPFSYLAVLPTALGIGRSRQFRQTVLLSFSSAPCIL